MLLDAARASSQPRPKVLFVAEQFVPPVRDGSTLVYKMWIDHLAEFCELYAILFDYQDRDPADAERYLAARCAGYAIFPAQSRTRLWKTARAASRRVTGTLFAPRWLEQWGRAPVLRTIGEFLARHDPEVLILSKLNAIYLFGEENILRANATVLLDLHDDFVTRDCREREVLTGLLARFPQLRQNEYFRHMRLRHLLSRIVPERARRQERRLLGLADCVLSTSRQEHAFYCATLQGVVPCERLNWPIEQRRETRHPPPRVSFDAGFIGGDHPFNVEGILFFCEKVLPLIRRDRPEFRFLIAGGVTRPLSLIAPHGEGVVIEGFLPDIRQFYDRVAVAVVPLLSGTGVSLKTREALDFGRPVVATAIGARGLDPVALPGLTVAESPDAFAQAVIASGDVPQHHVLRRPMAGETGFREAFAGVLDRHGGRRGRAVARAPDCASKSGTRR